MGRAFGFGLVDYANIGNDEFISGHIWRRSAVGEKRPCGRVAHIGDPIPRRFVHNSAVFEHPFFVLVQNPKKKLHRQFLDNYLTQYQQAAAYRDHGGSK